MIVWKLMCFGLTPVTKNKVWLIYAYLRAADGIAGYVWGKLNYKTAKKLRGKLKAHLQNPVFRHKALIAGKEKKEYQELP